MVFRCSFSMEKHRFMSGHRTSLLAGVSAAAVILLAGCSASSSSVTGSAAPPEEAVAGGTLRVANSSDYNCLDGQQARGSELQVASQVLDSLTEQDPETGALVGKLAKSWEVSDDAREFTFQLRDDVTFHDGTPFTAASVKRNLESIASLGARSSLGQTYVYGLQTVEVLGDHEVKIVFAQPNAQFLQATSTVTLGFYADATLDRTPEERCDGDVIGTGPFAFSYNEDNQVVTLVRNEDYNWGSELAEHEGPAYLDEVVFTVIPEAQVRIGSLTSGQVDFTGINVQDEPALESAGYPLYYSANPGAPVNLWPNVQTPVLQDEHVRYAISKGIDREQLVTVLFPEQSPATNTVSQSTPGYASNAELLAYDPEGAGKLLDEAGWELGDDGIRYKDGQPLTVELTDYYQYAYFELIQQQLKEIGIDLQIKTVTFAERSVILENGDYEIISGGLTRADPDIIRTVYAIDQQNTNQRIERIPLDDLFQETLTVTDDAERYALLAGSISEQLITEGYALPLVESLGAVATAKDVKGFRYDATSRYIFSDTWIQSDGE